ncbi:MAG: FtsW/RodA/SpoVE family cell cycle protein [Coriobacteriia bacterium]|nr:FtsW/RodA/SpoVE family cell cycle protein [Coriobacteriia bacterium]
MAFSASSNDAIIRQVYAESQAAQDASLSITPTADATDYHDIFYSYQNPDIPDDSNTLIGHIATLFDSAYANGFRQVIFVLIGTILAFAISRFDYKKFAPLAIPVAVVILISLAMLLVIGRPIMGSARWFNFFGLFAIQPSEFAKPVLLVLVAYYCSKVKDAEDAGINHLQNQTDLPVWQRDWFMPAILVLGCLAAILFSPDVGTTMIICVGLFAAYVLAGWPWLRVVAGGIVIAAIYTVRLFLQGGYGQARLTGFLSTWLDGETPHQTWQAELALGSGGITGLGPGLSRQKFRYLPEAQNDFIIAIVGEELGLIGVSLILIAFVLILFGGMNIASRATDRLGQSIAGGATVLILFQALLNIFAVISLGPVTGKPLPFVTLGGSSMISTFILIGLIFSVARFGAVATTSARRSSIESSAQESKSDQPPDKNRRKAGVGGRRNARRRTASRNNGEGVTNDEDEDDIEWRWDSGAHLSGPGARR